MPKQKVNHADGIRAALVAEIIEQMETNPGTWSRSWSQQLAAGLPYNATTGRAYRGGNVLWLLLVGQEAQHATNAWATFKQWKDAGASVRRGERGTHCLFWKSYDKESGEVDPETGEPVKFRRMIARTFVVFNRAQVDVVEPDVFAARTKITDAPAPLTPTADRAECAAWFGPIPADVVEGPPSYNPTADRIAMPPLDAFTDAAHYYGTRAHETTHWTGHKSRLNRPRHTAWGDDAYAFEELVAELGAVFVCAHLGIEHQTRPDHVAYLASWAQRFKENPQALWSAATKASDAFDHLMSYHEAMIPASA